MDQSTLRKRYSPNLLGVRIKTQIAVIRDRYLTFTNIFKFLFPLIIIILILPVASALVVNEAYKERIITDSQNLPAEIRTISVVIYYNDVLNNPDSLKSLATEAEVLYNLKRVSAVYVYAIGTNPSQEQISPYFKDVPANNLFIDLVAKDPFTFCNEVKNTYSINKTIILSYQDFLPRLNYMCNSIGIYTVGYSPSPVLSNNNEDSISKTLRDVIKANLNI